MAEAGGYDLNDPFIDDGNLNNQETYINVLIARFLECRYLNLLLSKRCVTIQKKPTLAKFRKILYYLLSIEVMKPQQIRQNEVRIRKCHKL